MVLDANQNPPTGETYADIDVAKAEYVKAANEALGSMRTKSARWLSYSISLRSFELVVCDPSGGGDSLTLNFAACEYISGPVSWPNQQLILVWHCDRSNLDKPWEFVLQDESVGFRLVARTFTWQQRLNTAGHGKNDSQIATS